MRIVLTLCIVMFIGCASEKIVEVKKKDVEKQKREEELMNKAVRVEQDLFSLVGCQMMKSVSVVTKEKKKQSYLLKKKAKNVGGNVLNNINFSEAFEKSGETIFEMGARQYFASADVYRCMM